MQADIMLIEPLLEGFLGNRLISQHLSGLQSLSGTSAFKLASLQRNISRSG